MTKHNDLKLLLENDGGEDGKTFETSEKRNERKIVLFKMVIIRNLKQS